MNAVEWETYINLVNYLLSEPEYQLDGIIYGSDSEYEPFFSTQLVIAAKISRRILRPRTLHNKNYKPL